MCMYRLLIVYIGMTYRDITTPVVGNFYYIYISILIK